LRQLFCLAILFRSEYKMGDSSRGDKNPAVGTTIVAASQGQNTEQGNVHGKELVNHIFNDPEALVLLRDAILSKAPSQALNRENAGALKEGGVRVRGDVGIALFMVRFCGNF
jgi:hypothetical protein